MCLKPEPINPVPAERACVAKAALPKGSAFIRMRDEQRANRLVQFEAWNALAGSASLSNTLALTEIVGNDALACSLVIAHRHALAAASTEQESL